jgi:hypothetical protein
MAKSLVFVIVSIFTMESLFPNVDLAELSHLPDLWSHFEKHRLESTDISLLEFLNLHYNDPQHSSATPMDHQNLPFSKNRNHRTPPLQIVIDVVKVTPHIVYTCLREIQGVNYFLSYPNKVASAIWQPPKI